MKTPKVVTLDYHNKAISAFVEQRNAIEAKANATEKELREKHQEALEASMIQISKRVIAEVKHAEMAEKLRDALRRNSTLRHSRDGWFWAACITAVCLAISLMVLHA